MALRGSMMTKKKDPKDILPSGPHKIELDPTQLEALAAMQCTFDEIASGLGVSVKTLERRRAEDPELDDAIKRGREQGARSLRRIQWESAEAGNVTMQIWLGKQWLKQADRSEQKLEVTQKGPLVIVRKSKEGKDD